MEVGYRMDYPLVNLSPFVAMQATSLQMNRFTESDRFETHASKPFAVTDTKSICHWHQKNDLARPKDLGSDMVMLPSTDTLDY